ncbi:MAG: winged helix-turn-helix domain-containing protein [Pseudomonadota bacterium]
MMDSPQNRYMRADELVVDLLDQRASRDGEPIALAPKSFELLVVLMRSSPTLVTKDTIFAEVWASVFVSDAALTTAVKELRQSLGDTIKTQDWVQTVRGKGYRFRKPVETYDAPDQPLPLATASRLDNNRSIAVLPFADMSPERDQEYFSDGISEEILNALANVPGLLVVGRTSSFAFKNQNEDVREIGNKLSVSHVLEGSVRKQGDRVRITAQLIQVDDGFHLWSNTYDGKLVDVFDLQERIAIQIADALQIVFNVDAEGPFAKALTSDCEAHDLYLRGKALVDIRAGDTTLTQAVKLLERATKIDPKFAEAWAELARANNTLPQYTLVEDSNVYLDRASKAALTALDLDPSLARAHLAASGIDSRKFTLTKPYHRLIKAVELDPRDPDVMGAFGYYWCIIGHIDKAIETGETALALDPMNATNNWTLALAHINAGSLDRARGLLEESLGLGFLPAAMVLPHVFALSGDRGMARDWLERAFMPMNELFHQWNNTSDFSTLLADAVHTDNADRRRDLKHLLHRYTQDPSTIINTQILSFLVNIEDYETFMDLFTTYTFSGDTYILCTLWDSSRMATGLRRHDRFALFADTIGLSEAWAEHGPPDWQG